MRIRRGGRATALVLGACLAGGLSVTTDAGAQFMTGQRVERERATADQARASRELVEQVGFDQNLGAQLPLDLTFRDEQGREVRLGDFFGDKPVVLGLVYYRCPVLCTLVERGLASGLKPLDIEPGDEFEVVFVSIDPTDTPEAASERRQATLDAYGRDSTAAGWHFLTGDAGPIARLAEAVGFRYAFDESTRQYAHAAGITVATPAGKMARYLYGVDYAPRDLKFALVEASEGAVGSPTDKLLLVCFRYDATLGKYTAATMTILRIAATATLVALGLFFYFTLRRGRRSEHAAAGGVA